MADLSREDIRIGTLVKGNGAPGYIEQILPHGFESFSLTFWQVIDTDIDQLAAEVNAVLEGTGVIISSVCIYGNPLGDQDKDQQTRDGWAELIDKAHLFGCDIVGGFAGRVRGKPIPESMDRYKEVFGALSDQAGEKGVRLAFENCQMGGDWNSGDWNIAHTPDCWELMFNAVPADNIGLQWEPCHQMVALIDPIPQLSHWVDRVFHLHGKDASVMWPIIKQHGIKGPKHIAWHRTPGFGDSNWTDIISILRQGGFKGSIDIEGWHDPVYREDLEMTGQVHGLNYLKWCRGESYVPNPTV